MEHRKLTKEDIDKVRNIEGFPIANDEDIIALSNAPYYTACPNPFIKEFIKENGTPYNEENDDYHREPFTIDVSEGKNDSFYMAHSYHTKVPHKAIMKYILHYTNPGDVVYDGFCGSGMTGVAAQMCGTDDQYTKMEFEGHMKGIKWGPRSVILSDLAPIATHIAAGYNTNVDICEFEDKAKRILSECQTKYSWMYETNHDTENLFGNLKGHINYIAWSDVVFCPNCGKELILYDVLWNPKTKKMSDEFNCPQCNTRLKKIECDKAIDVEIDELTGETRQKRRSKPVLINYSIGSKRFEKKLDKSDLQILDKINKIPIPTNIPSSLFLNKGENWGDTWRSGTHIGITNVHHFYRKRTLLVLSFLYEKCKDDQRLRFWFTSCLPKLTIMNRYMPQHGSRALVGPMSGTMYVSQIGVENNVIDQFEFQLGKMIKVNCNNAKYCISTQSLTDAKNIPDNCIDYIFTDPPFGANINYSELSFLWESWLRVTTNNGSEAIVSPVQKKSNNEYSDLMLSCFKQYYRVLKPNRWITVEFHNSQNAIWYSIQQAITGAGFVIADVRVLDKQKGTIKQLINTTSVQQDLVITAYKPSQNFKSELLLKAGEEETAWSFINQHLEKLPIVVEKNGKIEPVVEREQYLLFDRMVAYHIMNGITVPIDAIDFYRGLNEKYIKRDEMYFLPNQVNQYDNARIKADVEPIQYTLIVTNEKSAISWLYRQLDTPQTYAEIQPKFMQEVKSIDKFENMPELSVLLAENFLQDEKGKWYIPDTTKEADVAKLREKNLIKEFEGYLSLNGKLRLFRIEAIRAGFAKLWKEKNYKLIVETAERLPESTIQEDDKLLMYYDISLGRV